MPNVKTNTCPIPQNVNNGSAIIQNSTGACGTACGTGTAPSNVLTCFTAGSNDSILDQLTVCTDEASTIRVLSFWLYDGSSVYTFIGAISIPLTSGITGAIPVVDVLGSAIFLGLCYDAGGRPIMKVKAGYSIVVGSQVAVTSGKTLHVKASGADY